MYCQEHTESDVADIAPAGLDARLSFELERRVVAEEHLGSVLDCATSGVNEFLQENFAVHAVCLLFKDCAEDDGHAVVRGLDVDSLLVAVVDSSHTATLSYTLRCGLGCVLGSLLVQSSILVKCLLKRCGHGVALEQADLPHQLILLLLALGQVLKVDLHAEVVALLGRNNVGAVLALQNLLGAVLDQLAVAFYAGGDQDAGLGFGGADVEGDVVEVGDDLVDGGGRGAARECWLVGCCMVMRLY